MTAMLVPGQTVAFAEGGRERHGTVEATWAQGKRGVVKAADGEVFTIRADQVGKPVSTTLVGVDLDEAERLALAVLDGAQVGGSVSGQMLKLAAAVVTLRHGGAA